MARMLRGFRHTLFVLLQCGVVLSALLAWAVQPSARLAVAICMTGAMLVIGIGERIARRWLRTTLGRLRRAAEDISRGRPAAPLTAQRGDDLYKLVSAVNLLATRLEEATREEARLQDQLRRTERLAFLGELAASVAHEINNPLDGALSAARILRRSSDDPERSRQMLDVIDAGLARIDLIVRRLLTLARENVIRPVEARMSAVLEGALAAVANRLADQGIRVVRQFEARDDRLQADPHLLEQVFVNLLLNAADSLADGVGELRLVLRREPGPEAGGVLAVEVRDTGSGIAPDVLPHIFEPFYTTRRGGKGTGLGLPIAARIVDAHQGTISVDSQVGRGTTFTVRVPALHPPPAAGLPRPWLAVPVAS